MSELTNRSTTTGSGDEGSLPLDLGEETITIAREVHVEDDSIVSAERGAERRLASVQQHGHSGIEADYQEARSEFEHDFTAHRAQAQPTRTFSQAEPNYRAGFIAGRDLNYEGQEFEAIEADLRREYESSTASAASTDTGDLDTGWDALRAEIRHGFQRARGHS
jgi:hypothetical protein